MRHVLSILCERISTDRDTNSVSYLTCIEQASSATLPAAISTVSLGTLWHNDDNGPTSLEMRVVLVTPSGKEGEVVHVGPAPVEHRVQRVNVSLDGLRLGEPGLFELRVEQMVNESWQVEARIPLLLIHTQQNRERDPVSEEG
jgi:hypothetical protein